MGMYSGGLAGGLAVGAAGIAPFAGPGGMMLRQDSFSRLNPQLQLYSSGADASALQACFTPRESFRAPFRACVECEAKYLASPSHTSPVFSPQNTPRN